MTGAAHSHEQPLTIEQTVELAKLQRMGHYRPSFASREEILAWLEANRFRIAPSPKRPSL